MIFSSIGEWICQDSPQIFEEDWRNGSWSALPHVSSCTQHLDLSWLPAIFLLMFSPVTLYDLHKSDNLPLRCASPITYRIIICVILIVDLTVSIFHNFTSYLSEESGYSGQYLYGDVVQCVGLCSALLLLIACKNRGVITSGVLFNYWLLMTICGFPEFRFLIARRNQENVVGTHQFVLYMVYYALVCLELLLSCFADSTSAKHLAPNECQELHGSFLNQITFHWFTGLAIVGNKRPLERSDLFTLNDRDLGKNLLPGFEDNFKPILKNFQRLLLTKCDVTPKDHPSILIPVFKTYKWTFMMGAMYKLVFDLMQFVAPHLLSLLITFIQDSNQPLYIGVSIAFLMFVSALVQSMILHQYFHSIFRLGMNIRTVLTGAVYKKALNLSNNARKSRTVGEIVNLMSVDIQRFQDMTNFVMLFWSAPLQILLSIFFLYRLLGVAVLSGLCILILMIPFNSWISVKIRNCQVEQMKYKDERIKMMSEILNGIKVLKLYAWEESMQKMILNIRDKELYVLKKLAFLNAATTFSWSCAPFLVAVLTFGVYVLIDPENNLLTPQITFVAIALFNILRFPLAILAMITSQAVQVHVSNNRLKAFFASEDMADGVIEHGSSQEEAINLENASFSWESEEELNLKHINLSIKKNSLVAVVGRVGTGKSSLLQAILGEMNKRAGRVSVNGSVAYVPQQAWIQNMTLKDNVLFNRPCDMTKYNRVLEACALMKDVESLPAGDATEIGEKGINLSGGQKQRVSLARAIYAQSDIVLLDDPLSAVDAHVGKHIFEHVISSTSGLLKNTTRLLVTHGLTYLKYCDQIVVIKDGEISEIGTYRELIAQQGAFNEFLEEFLVEEAKNRGRSVSFGENEENVKEILNEMEKISPGRRKRIESQLSVDVERTRRKSDISLDGDEKCISNGGEKSEDGQCADQTNDEKAALLTTTEKIGKTPPPVMNKIIEKENIETGKVEWRVYSSYLMAIGVPISILFISVYIGSSVLGVGSNLWLARWSDDAKIIQQSSNGSNSETNRRLLIYTALGLGQAFFVCAASVIMALGMVRASRILHEGMLRNCLHSPMMFFDVTPLGRILNRFGKDVDLLDSRLPGVTMTFLSAVIQAAMILFVPIYMTPSISLPLLPTFIAYYFVLRFYVSTSRQLKRLESATRSPIYSHFQESIQGASSIRAYKMMDHFIVESQRRVDENLSTYYPSIVANRWLAVRLELVGNMIVFFAALFAALFRDSPGLSPGLVGLSVAYALNITQTLNWAVRMTSELETNIVAVERIKEYSDTPTEGTVDPEERPEDWPPNGDIQIKNYSLRYRPGLDLVLRGVTAHIRPQEKVGIVGRTGAGKSSLTLAMFRIVEADGGYIEIDGQNIARLSLEDLRSRLTIVPQDPVLFSGTLRVNLDPFHRFGDDVIWEALRNAHLYSFVDSLQDQLNHRITEGGENLSVGQRQLICLARALLRKTKVLILDEAAAAVDVETDALLQKTIREQFKHCTVLTIAHRLNTVMDSDRLLVMDKGEVAEFDSPRNLLAKKDSIFYGMAKDAAVV